MSIDLLLDDLELVDYTDNGVDLVIQARQINYSTTATSLQRLRKDFHTGITGPSLPWPTNTTYLKRPSRESSTNMSARKKSNAKRT